MNQLCGLITEAVEGGFKNFGVDIRPDDAE